MRKSKEINRAIALLRLKGDRLSLIRAEVLSGRRTEVWVFKRFVRDAAPEEKDEAVYCAARDAARYVSGKLELEQLIPGGESLGSADVPPPPAILPTPNELWEIIQRLSARVESLENRINRKTRHAKK